MSVCKGQPAQKGGDGESKAVIVRAWPGVGEGGEEGAEN